ncbi:MurR/RpiR family transcriptional regulator [Cryobacterium melibiosiphilum]|uniref:MurR/RpiR family transcriptional regulator n=1 Tax=Cryobacterium melibiosiphilum TaxID=995039 RepID=A0A3A5MC53_9MICO|nr:MurR/RpiR family transcriptional regulator [Cryobacterium melibiosiphilum]
MAEPPVGSGAPITVRVAAVRNTLQPTERRVADLIVSEPELVVELTAQQVADRVGVARSSVVRASQSLGYRGYPQLRMALAGELGAHDSFDHGEGAIGRLRTVMDRTARALNNSTSLLDVDELEGAIDLIARARRVFVVANGLSASVASNLATRLTSIGRSAEIVPDAVSQQIAARQLTPDDVCVVVSGTGTNEFSLRTAAAAVSAGANVIAITSFQKSDLTGLAHRVLVVAPASFRDELEHYSRVAQAAFVEALVDLVAEVFADRAQHARGLVLEILSDNLGDTIS